jgi:GntR family transcriptional repressor for pyruvate dehydrogenase complex
MFSRSGEDNGEGCNGNAVSTVMEKEAARDLGLQPVPQRRAFENVILHIEEAIIDGRLAVGDHLPPERELAEIFQVSRASVREALRVLEAFGILTARRGTGPDAGSIVTGREDGLATVLRIHASLVDIPVADLVAAREVLEMWTGDLATQRASASEIDELAAIVGDMRLAREPPNFLELDTRFHIAIARASGNITAALLMTALREAMARQMLSAFHVLRDWPAEREALIRSHADILEKIRSGEGEETARALSGHIQDFYTRAFKNLDSAPASIAAPKKTRPRQSKH